MVAVAPAHKNAELIVVGGMKQTTHDLGKVAIFKITVEDVGDDNAQGIRALNAKGTGDGVGLLEAQLFGDFQHATAGVFTNGGFAREDTADRTGMNMGRGRNITYR